MKTIFFYPGTFDPFTKGHLSVVLEALANCDKLIIAIGENQLKKTFLFNDAKKRIDLINLSILDCIEQYKFRSLNGTIYSINEEKAILKLIKVPQCLEVISYKGLTVHAAARYGANFIIRGERLIGDHDAETMLADANRRIAATFNYSYTQVLIPTPRMELTKVSSTQAKELCEAGQFINAMDYVMPSVHNEMMKLYLKPIFMKLAKDYGMIDHIQNIYYKLVEVYSEDDRKHHNLSHLAYGINLMETYRAVTGEPLNYDLVLLAFFYHRTISTKNLTRTNGLNQFFEEYFMKFFSKGARMAFFQEDKPKRVEKMLANTTRLGEGDLQAREEKLLCDIDLATLGDQKNYGLYAQNIRLENMQMSDLEYARSRHKLLNKLKKRDLFSTEFFSFLNEKAKLNMNNEKAYWLNVKETTEQ